MEKSKKELKKEKKAAKKAAKKAGSLLADFKAFISRGNVLDMAVGVVIGGAFSAIVTAVVNLLLSVCMWGVPGGINGLITVLPAVTDVQQGFNPALGLGQMFAKGDLQVLAQALAVDTYGAAAAGDPLLVEACKTTILGKYTLYGGTYAYNASAIINWGAVINAVISFLIVAIVLFVIVKTVAYFGRLKADLDAKTKEAYYQKHPEERPAPVEPEAPKPTEAELLTQIRDLLAEQKK